jgi:hypothetical protein
MNESHIMGCIASALQFTVAAYALRLNRRYGTSRVGWSLFGAFSLLAMLQLVQSAGSLHAQGDSSLMINASYVLISFLMLIGMIHLESMLKERSRLECVEQKLRIELESEVKSKTAHLTRAIEELMNEMEETKRMSAIIETSHWTKLNKTAESLVPAVVEPAASLPPPEWGGETGGIFAGLMGGELLARF